jgi:hypothetical protein
MCSPHGAQKPPATPRAAGPPEATPAPGAAAARRAPAASAREERDPHAGRERAVGRTPGTAGAWPSARSRCLPSGARNRRLPGCAHGRLQSDPGSSENCDREPRDHPLGSTMQCKPDVSSAQNPDGCEASSPSAARPGALNPLAINPQQSRQRRIPSPAARGKFEAHPSEKLSRGRRDDCPFMLVAQHASESLAFQPSPNAGQPVRSDGPRIQPHRSRHGRT